MSVASKIWKTWLALVLLVFLLALIAPKGSLMFGSTSGWFTDVGVLMIGIVVLVPLLLIALIATSMQMASKRVKVRRP